MPDCLAIFTPTPGRVHENARALSGHHPCWMRPEYAGGIWRRDHYRICSYCGCIHPGDLLDLLRAGGSRIEQARKPGKFIFWTPNPIAGELCRMGSMPGSIFARAAWPQTLRDRLRNAPRRDLEFQPSLAERAACHFERPMLEPAPPLIEQAFFLEHTAEPQWAAIEAAASKREPNDPSLSSPRAYERDLHRDGPQAGE